MRGLGSGNTPKGTSQMFEFDGDSSPETHDENTKAAANILPNSFLNMEVSLGLQGMTSKDVMKLFGSKQFQAAASQAIVGQPWKDTESALASFKELQEWLQGRKFRAQVQKTVQGFWHEPPMTNLKLLLQKAPAPVDGFAGAAWRVAIFTVAAGNPIDIHMIGNYALAIMPKEAVDDLIDKDPSIFSPPDDVKDNADCVASACEEGERGGIDTDCCAIPKDASCKAGFKYHKGDVGCGWGKEQGQQSTCCVKESDSPATPPQLWSDLGDS